MLQMIKNLKVFSKCIFCHFRCFCLRQSNPMYEELLLLSHESLELRFFFRAVIFFPLCASDFYCLFFQVILSYLCACPKSCAHYFSIQLHQVLIRVPPDSFYICIFICIYMLYVIYDIYTYIKRMYYISYIYI